MGSSNRLDGDTVVTGGAIGGAVYVLGYLVVYVTQSGSVADRLSGYNFLADLFGGDPIPVWKGVGWLFYNAHAVETVIPGFGGRRTENFIATADDGSLTWLYVLPPLLLLAAGYAVARYDMVGSPSDGAIRGAAVTVGYLPLALVGAFVFRATVGDGTVAPDPITAVALAGLLYPIVAGGVGGALAGFLGRA